MFLFHVIVQSILRLENVFAVATSQPMLILLMLLARSAHVSRPSSETPATLDLVAMVGAIVEVITDAVVIERTATTRIHILAFEMR